MFQNMLLASLVTPLCETDENSGWENRPFKTIYPEQRSQKVTKGGDITRTIKKRNKRVRIAYTTDQLRLLERTFTKSRYIDSESRRRLANQLKVADKSVKVWFQNRRMKEKRDSESSCDSSVSTECFASPQPVQHNADVNPVNDTCMNIPYSFPEQFLNPQWQTQQDSHITAEKVESSELLYSCEYLPAPQWNAQQDFDYKEENVETTSGASYSPQSSSTQLKTQQESRIEVNKTEPITVTDAPESISAPRWNLQHTFDVKTENSESHRASYSSTDSFPNSHWYTQQDGHVSTDEINSSGNYNKFNYYNAQASQYQWPNVPYNYEYNFQYPYAPIMHTNLCYDSNVYPIGHFPSTSYYQHPQQTNSSMQNLESIK